MEPLHVAAWIEGKTRSLSAPTVKQHLAAIRHLFDWLVNVRSYRAIHLIGAWPVACGENRQNADIGRRRSPSPDCQYRHQHTAGLRDRALIALMVYSFARIGAAVGMKVEDVYTQNHRLWVRLREKDGKRHEMPCHHNLEEYLVAYIDGTELRDDLKGLLFRTIGRGTGQLTASPLAQANAHAMIQRRMVAAGIATKAGNHSFRATGITAYLKNGGSLEKAAVMANHASNRTPQLYDRRRDEMTLDEVEKIGI